MKDPRRPRHEQYLPSGVDYDCCGDCNAATGGYVPWPCVPAQLEQSRAAAERLRARLTAFARDCTLNGDMTPTAERMLHQILEES